MISVIVPTYNAASYLPNLFERLKEQTLSHELIIIDSDSSDGTQALVNQQGAILISISKSDFNHGATRNIGIEASDSDILVFMTQDALPASSTTLETLVSMLTSRSDIAMAYGRQIPYKETGIFGRMARLTNYPPVSVIKTKQLIPEMGIKTCSCSNSFAAYYKKDLLNVGGFPSDTILGEDVSVAARFILQGKAVAYSAEAMVFHSHDYTVTEEFKRYFDIGAFHQSQQLVLKPFSNAESEGFKYVLQEWDYLRSNNKSELIPSQVLRTIAKYTGYKLGRKQYILPTSLKRMLSMHTSFWD